MQALDEDLWHIQQAELKEDDIGRAFLDFIIDWIDLAERALEVDDSLAPISALRASFPLAEQGHGRISASFVGQMLVVIVSHWIHGQQISSEMSTVERRLMEDMLILKLRELQESAKLPPDIDENVTRLLQS